MKITRSLKTLHKSAFTTAVQTAMTTMADVGSAISTV